MAYTLGHHSHKCGFFVRVEVGRRTDKQMARGVDNVISEVRHETVTALAAIEELRD